MTHSYTVNAPFTNVATIQKLLFQTHGTASFQARLYIIQESFFIGILDLKKIARGYHSKFSH